MNTDDLADVLETIAERPRVTKSFLEQTGVALMACAGIALIIYAFFALNF